MLRTSQFVVILALACPVASIILGCGGDQNKAKRQEVCPVSVNVTLNGAPLEGATVLFITEDKEGRGASGSTDKEGKAKLMTFATDDGAVPGRYKITVNKVDTTGGGDVVTMDNYGDMIKKANASRSQKSKSAPPKPLILPIYSDASSTKLRAEVVKGQENSFTFEVGK